MKGITLSLSDPAGETMLPIFIEKGFKETPTPNIYQHNDTILIAAQPLIVPEEPYKMPKTPRPYPLDYNLLAEKYELEYIAVASRHWAQSGKPSLTAHPTGNFGKAMYGGRHRELQYTAPNPMRNIYNRLYDAPPEGFQISLEATHHSPTEFNVPMFFVEVGSREEQWQDSEVCEYLVNCILAGMEETGSKPVAIGFGGGHYCPKFSAKMNDYAMGHMAARYAIDLLTDDLVSQMIEKSQGPEFALIDGLKGRQKRKVESLLEKTDLEIA
ncbi:MAG: D-aminoacyl-tRNA deacylase [Candidatus Bathyarchaeota archaeon]|nr:D-aminoacyl-tRNA deacylase [Candidatus Bathyarchaeota archaeon]